MRAGGLQYSYYLENKTNREMFQQDRVMSEKKVLQELEHYQGRTARARSRVCFHGMFSAHWYQACADSRSGLVGAVGAPKKYRVEIRGQALRTHLIIKLIMCEFQECCLGVVDYSSLLRSFTKSDMRVKVLTLELPLNFSTSRPLPTIHPL